MSSTSHPPIIQYKRNFKMPQGTVSSALLGGVPPEHRVDGFDNAFCIFEDSRTVIVMSSGGKGALSCDQLNETARQIGRNISSQKIVKVRYNLFTIVRRVG